MSRPYRKRNVISEWRSTIAAAQAGDRRALDELVEGWLPLVHNVVGRALNGHSDVDDVVQETMPRAVGNLGSLRDPDSFRSWLVAIVVRQIRDRARRRQPARLDESAAHEAGDFAELTVLRLQLGSAARGRGGGALAGDGQPRHRVHGPAGRRSADVAGRVLPPRRLGHAPPERTGRRLRSGRLPVDLEAADEDLRTGPGQGAIR